MNFQKIASLSINFYFFNLRLNSYILHSARDQIPALINILFALI